MSAGGHLACVSCTNPIQTSGGILACQRSITFVMRYNSLDDPQCRPVVGGYLTILISEMQQPGDNVSSRQTVFSRCCRCCPVGVQFVLGWGRTSC